MSIEQDAKGANNEGSGTAKIEELINKRFDNIDRSIDAMIEQKLAAVFPPATSASSNPGETKKSFSTALTTAFRNSKNEAVVQEKEREKRSTNLIIYGIGESSEGDPKEHDKTFVASLLEKIGVAQRPKQLFRLGAQADGKTRPVKLIMETEADKDTIMARLGNLKNAEDAYRKVSIRDDYTVEEREMVREYVKKAEAKNLAENTQEWKV